MYFLVEPIIETIQDLFSPRSNFRSLTISGEMIPSRGPGNTRTFSRAYPMHRLVLNLVLILYCFSIPKVIRPTMPLQTNIFTGLPYTPRYLKSIHDLRS